MSKYGSLVNVMEVVSERMGSTRVATLVWMAVHSIKGIVE